MKKEITHRCETIIVGNCLSALMCGYETGHPVLTLNAAEPFFFETFEPKSKLALVGFENINRVLKTPTGEIHVGIEKREVYRKLAFKMALAGQLPLSNGALSMRLVDDNTIKVVLDHARSAKFKFENVIIFQNELLVPRNPPKYMVLDWMNVRSGMVHPFDRIESTTPFVNCIHFYPSERIDGEHDKKDLVSVSYLTKEQLQSYEFSDTYARFKIVEEMKAAGIRGARNGRDTLRPGKYKYYSVKVESEKRQVVPLHNRVVYYPTSETKSQYLRYLADIL